MLLKFVQSDEARNPLVEALACGMESVLPENDKGLEMVVDCTLPFAFVDKTPEGMLVITRFVVVAFVAVKPTMLATDASNVFTIAVPKSASVEKRSVDVALVAIKFVVVLFAVMLPVDDAALNEIVPAVKFPPTLRSPEREVFPDTDKEFAATGPPEIDVFEIDPPVIDGLVIAVPES